MKVMTTMIGTIPTRRGLEEKRWSQIRPYPLTISGMMRIYKREMSEAADESYECKFIPHGIEHYNLG